MKNRDKRLFAEFRYNGMKLLQFTRAFKLANELSECSPYSIDREKFKHYADVYYVRRDTHLIKYITLKLIIRPYGLK